MFPRSWRPVFVGKKLFDTVTTGRKMVEWRVGWVIQQGEELHEHLSLSSQVNDVIISKQTKIPVCYFLIM